MAGIIEQLDAALANLLSGWNVYSSVLLVGIVGFVVFVMLDTQDADTHPLLLARQAQAAYIRQPGESPAFRSPETPHGCTSRPLLANMCPAADMLQIHFAPASWSSLRALPCTPLGATVISATSGAA